MHPPNPKMKRGACQGTPDFISEPSRKNTEFEQIAQLETAEIRARHISRLYAVSFATAATIARLAYSVAP
jgi:hypothetical protein